MCGSSRYVAFRWCNITTKFEELFMYVVNRSSVIAHFVPGLYEVW